MLRGEGGVGGGGPPQGTPGVDHVASLRSGSNAHHIGSHYDFIECLLPIMLTAQQVLLTGSDQHLVNHAVLPTLSLCEQQQVMKADMHVSDKMQHHTPAHDSDVILRVSTTRGTDCWVHKQGRVRVT